MWLLYVIIILVIIGIIVLIKLVHNAIKIIWYSITLIVIIGLVLGLWIVLDATSFKNNFLVKEKKFLLTEENNILAGYSTKEFEDNIYFSRVDLMDYQELLDEEKYKEIKADSWRLFIYDIDVFDEYFEQELELPHSFYNVSGRIYEKTLKEDDPRDYFIEVFINETKDYYGGTVNYQDYERQLNDYFETNEIIKGKLFNSLLQEAIVDKGFLFIIKDVRKGDVIVEPETMLFKALKFTPKSMFNKTVLNIRIRKAKDELWDKVDVWE